MFETLAKEFLSSSAAGETLNAIKEQAGLGQQEAEGVVNATAQGAANALSGDGGGLGALVGGLLGGGGGGGGGLGGLGGLVGGLLGGGQQQQQIAGLPPAVTDGIISFVVDKTGIDKTKVSLAVAVALPKLVEFVKSKT